MDKMSLDTIYSNIDMIDQYAKVFNKNPEDIKSGKISLGCQGDRLVFVSNSTSIFTRIANFFRGISTDRNRVTKIVHATQVSLESDERLLLLANKVAFMNPASKAMKLAKDLAAARQEQKYVNIIKRIPSDVFNGGLELCYAGKKMILC